MEYQNYVIGFGIVTLLALVALGASGAAASPADAAASTGPVVDSLDDSPAHHCGPNESHVDPFYCIYNPPCDATCVEFESAGAAQVR